MKLPLIACMSRFINLKEKAKQWTSLVEKLLARFLTFLAKSPWFPNFLVQSHEVIPSLKWCKSRVKQRQIQISLNFKSNRLRVASYVFVCNITEANSTRIRFDEWIELLLLFYKMRWTIKCVSMKRIFIKHAPTKHAKSPDSVQPNCSKPNSAQILCIKLCLS